MMRIRILDSFWITTRWALAPVLLGSLIVYSMLQNRLWHNELFHVLIESGGALIGFGLLLIVIGMIQKQRLATNYVWLHSCATFIGGLFAAMIWLSPYISKKFYNLKLLWILLFLSTSFSIWSIVWPDAGFAMLDEHCQFTFSAKFLNIIGGIGFLIAWAYFAREYHHQHYSESFFSPITFVCLV